MIDEQQFKDLMARIPSAVAVVTTGEQGNWQGVTVSTFGSLSLDPPLAFASILKENRSHDRLLAAQWFAINVLARDQTFFAEQFSGQTPLADPEFSRVPHVVSHRRLPMIEGCISWIECRPWAQYDGGDHTLFVGEIENLTLGQADDPLVYYDRKFVELAWN